MTARSFSAVLVVGGESRRMGKEKATILFSGRPLWQHQLDILRATQPAEVLVSARSDPPWRPADIEFVADAQPSRGPLSGISATLSRIANDSLLVLAIDMPFMSADYLRGLFELVPARGAVVPTVGGRFEPLAAIYPRSLSADFSMALSGNDFSLQSLIADLIATDKARAIAVSAGEKSFFRNLNEPGDIGPADYS